MHENAPNTRHKASVIGTNSGTKLCTKFGAFCDKLFQLKHLDNGIQ